MPPGLHPAALPSSFRSRLHEPRTAVVIGRWLGAAFVVCFLTGPISHGLQDQLSALPQHTEVLPISCVEGWSASAHWTGVRVRDLLEPAGAQAGARLRVVSLERHGGYATTEVEGSYARDPLTR